MANKHAYKIVGSLVSLILLIGCSFGGGSSNPFDGSSSWMPQPPSPTECTAALDVLNWTAALAILGGIVALVLTSGRIWRPIAIGIVLVILSYVMAVYSVWVLLPIGIILSTVLAIWGYKTITKLWRSSK